MLGGGRYLCPEQAQACGRSEECADMLEEFHRTGADCECTESMDEAGRVACVNCMEDAARVHVLSSHVHIVLLK